MTTKLKAAKEYVLYLQYAVGGSFGINEKVEKDLYKAIGQYAEESGSGFGFRDQQYYFDSKNFAYTAAQKVEAVFKKFGFKITKSGTYVTVKAIDKRTVNA